MTLYTDHTDVLIIGAGLAGLSTALSLQPSLKVTVLSKAALEVCSSCYAQGGIAACLDDHDRVSDHASDTLIAGAGLCDAAQTMQILAQGRPAVAWLCEQGVPFTPLHKDRGDEVLAPDQLHLTQEGGHGCRRIAHADDATGEHIMQTLITRAQAASHITILPYHDALDLIPTSDDTSSNESQRCMGARVFDQRTQTLLTIHSRAVVLASGGMGNLWRRASAPSVCTGDGVMMAWQAGCRLANLEFVQFHPTGLAVSGSAFLISEALRGEGAYLRCPITGERFMFDIDSRAELAPRDIVARAIADQITKNAQGYVHLDISHKSADFIQAHFPKIYHTLLDLGIDITREPIPVAPTAHYSCGGVVSDAHGASDVAGLYVAGEAAYTGLHGANRLASNSLLECVVMGRNIAEHIPKYLATGDWRSPVIDKTSVIDDSFDMLDTLHLSELPIDIDPSLSDVKTPDQMITPDQISQNLQTLMQECLGINRHQSLIIQAMQQIQHWLSQIDTSNDVSMTDQAAITRYKTYQQLRLAMLIARSAYQRIESRGGHYRSDYPNTNHEALTSMVLPATQKSKPIIKTSPSPARSGSSASSRRALAAAQS